MSQHAAELQVPPIVFGTSCQDQIRHVLRTAQIAYRFISTDFGRRLLRGDGQAAVFAKANELMNTGLPWRDRSSGAFKIECVG